MEKPEKQKEYQRDQRLATMAEGMEDLERWLLDFIRQGMAVSAAQQSSFWEDIAARMVDNKLGGIARKLRALASIQSTTTNWPEQMLNELGSIYLAARAFKRLEQIPTPLKADLLSLSGINFKKDILLQREGLQDHWMILGQIEGTDDKLNFRRSWLQGAKTRRMGLILEFTWGNADYIHKWEVGQIFYGTVVFYPSSFPMRVLVKEQSAPVAKINKMGGYPHFEAFMKAYAKALGTNPWMLQFPVMLADVIPHIHKKQLILIDQHQKQIVASFRQNTAWKLLALSHGQAINIFGEWNGNIFAPLSACAEDRFVAL